MNTLYLKISNKITSTAFVTNHNKKARKKHGNVSSQANV